LIGYERLRAAELDTRKKLKGCDHDLASELRHETVIAALLSESSLEAAAARAGISYVTLWRMLRDQDFNKAYKAAQREAMSQATARMKANAMQAVTTLETVMSEPGPRARAQVAAARAYLEFALRALELDDLQSRLDALEGKLSGKADEWGNVRYDFGEHEAAD
jgi:hypothetical protein